MSEELFLIAHKVRGQPAFDVAIRVGCSECGAVGCNECDDHGFWWIIPTSGHRAYPYWNFPLKHIACDRIPPNPHAFIAHWLDQIVPPMPDSLPDHYATRSAPPAARPSGLAKLLAAAPAPTLPPVPRRGF